MSTETVADRQPLAPQMPATLPKPQPRANAGFARPLTWAIAAVFAVLVVVALLVALTAALVVGATVAIAALVLRLAPRRRADDAPTELEARRTPDGWVVEAALRR